MEKTQEPRYRGVSRSDVLASLKNAERLIRSLDLGPATETLLDEWRGKDPYGRIAAAQTGKDMAETMRQTGSADIFRRMSEIFDYHAARDTAGTGFRIMQEIGAWGAFSGMELLDYRPVDAEWDRYLVKEYAGLAYGAGNQGHARMDEFLDALQQSQPQQVEDHENARDDVLLMLAEQDEEECLSQIGFSFSEGDLRDRHLMKTILSVLSGQAQAQQNLSRKGPIGQYGIVYEELKRGVTFREMHDVIDDDRRRMVDALAPFYETDEVEMTAIGAITRDFKHMGLVFHATERAALAVAKAFPERKVIDHNGQVIGGRPGPDYNGLDAPDGP